MNCSVCGKPTDGNRLLCTKHYNAGKAHDKVVKTVPDEDLEKRRKTRGGDSNVESAYGQDHQYI